MSLQVTVHKSIQTVNPVRLAGPLQVTESARYDVSKGSWLLFNDQASERNHVLGSQTPDMPWKGTANIAPHARPSSTEPQVLLQYLRGVQKPQQCRGWDSSLNASLRAQQEPHQHMTQNNTARCERLGFSVRLLYVRAGSPSPAHFERYIIDPALSIFCLVSANTKKKYGQTHDLHMHTHGAAALY